MDAICASILFKQILVIFLVYVTTRICYCYYFHPRLCNSLANSALKNPTGTFGIFAQNAIMLIRLVVFKFSGDDQTNIFFWLSNYWLVVVAIVEVSWQSLSSRGLSIILGKSSKSEFLVVSSFCR